MSDDLIARAREAAAGAGATHGEWGDRVEGLEDTDDLFQGRYRGEAEDEVYDGHSRRVHLLWDTDDQPCWVRGKWSLNLEFDRVRPNVGDTVVIVVGEAWEGKNGTSGFYFGVEAEPNDAPMPDDPAGPEADGTRTDDGIPF